MERDNDVIDLGAASIETRGNSGPKLDVVDTIRESGIDQDD